MPEADPIPIHAELSRGKSGFGAFRHSPWWHPGAMLTGNNRGQGRFGSSVDFGARRLAVGYPYVGTPLGGRVGQVWVYEEDGLFADDFED